MTEFLPGLDLTLAGIAFVLTFFAKALFRDFFKQHKVGTRLLPALPVILGVVAAFLFWVPKGADAATSMPSSLPSGETGASWLIWWKQTFGAGILNGFYSMGFFQLVRRAIFGKDDGKGVGGPTSSLMNFPAIFSSRDVKAVTKPKLVPPALVKEPTPPPAAPDPAAEAEAPVKEKEEEQGS